jgi:hypothetical protein
MNITSLSVSVSNSNGGPNRTTWAQSETGARFARYDMKAEKPDPVQVLEQRVAGLENILGEVLKRIDSGFSTIGTQMKNNQYALNTKLKGIEDRVYSIYCRV